MNTSFIQVIAFTMAVAFCGVSASASQYMGYACDHQHVDYDANGDLVSFVAYAQAWSSTPCINHTPDSNREHFLTYDFDLIEDGPNDKTWEAPTGVREARCEISVQQRDNVERPPNYDQGVVF